MPWRRPDPNSRGSAVAAGSAAATVAAARRPRPRPAGSAADPGRAPVPDGAAAPLVSATSLGKALGMATQNAAQLLDRFCADGVAIEVTHRSKRRSASIRRYLKWSTGQGPLPHQIRRQGAEKPTARLRTNWRFRVDGQHQLMHLRAPREIAASGVTDASASPSRRGDDRSKLRECWVARVSR
jgi:hypothetical protein